MKKNAPSAERNCRAIGDVLHDHLPGTGTVLEIASGTGQHAAAFARRFPGLHWVPSDPDSQARASIEAWRLADNAGNIAPAISIDVLDKVWHLAVDQPVQAVININMIHISPRRAIDGLMGGAGQLLPPGGILFVYSCFHRHGQSVSQSNMEFDEWLKARNAKWGVRDVDDMIERAPEHGFEHSVLVEMPANNTALIFTRQ